MLNPKSMGDDIREIESQNRGLQILAQNQQKLSRDLDYLLVIMLFRYRMEHPTHL